MSPNRRNYRVSVTETLALTAFLAIAHITHTSTAATQTPFAPTGLMCELMAQPELAPITDPRPEFTWVVDSP